MQLKPTTRSDTSSNNNHEDTQGAMNNHRHTRESASSLNNSNKRSSATTSNNGTNSNGITNKNELSSSSSNASNNIDESSENTTESKIKVGDEYQADLSKLDPKIHLQKRNNIIEREISTWKPTKQLDDKQLDDYLNEASMKHSYTIEQALALLFWNKYNLAKSVSDMSKYVPRPNEWTEEEKILFEQAYGFNGKNFGKIRQVLPEKSQASLVTYYYTWKKARLHTSHIENQQTNTKNTINSLDLSLNLNSNGTTSTELNENGNANEDVEMNNASDDNDSIDDNFNNNLVKICCNCDLITSELQSTPKGQLCKPCHSYWKDTGGLMRPDHLINKTSNHPHNHNYLQNSSFKTNRYLTISNTTATNTNETNFSKEARNFHKSLRKPPKGIYLNYEELFDFVKAGSSNVFDELSRRTIALKKQSQVNKQDIDTLIKTITKECEPLKSEINNLLFKSDEEEAKPTPYWTQREIKHVLQAFSKFGDDFETISQILITKTGDSIKAFYNYYRESLSLEKLISNNTRELNKKASNIFNDLKKQNRTDLPVNNVTSQTHELIITDEIVIN